MKRQHGTITLVASCVALGLGLVAGVATADDIAWDMVNSTSQNLISFTIDAPVFTSPGDGFQKYTVGVSPSIPYALVDDTLAGFPADEVGVIDASSDFNEFFGVTDTVNDDNTGPVSATWVFDISSATENLELQIDLAAMGDFEPSDSFVWTYRVDSGAVNTILTAAADEDGSWTYTMADGTTRTHDDPLVVAGTTLYNDLQTFSIPIAAGSQLTVTLTADTDGGSECYVVRNIMVIDNAQAATGGVPIPTMSRGGIVVMVLLLMAGGAFVLRRLHG